MKTNTKDAIILEVKQSLPPHYDYFNQQRWEQLRSRLAQEEPKLVGDALLTYWPTLQTYIEQTFVARLLFTLNPSTSLSLDEILVALSNWNLSVEEFPWYLTNQFGEEEVLQELRALEERGSRDEKLIRATETFRWWLKRRPAEQGKAG